eukprot:scaffold40999_cov66-Phaeocystis_antarctica.AAC.1
MRPSPEQRPARCWPAGAPVFTSVTHMSPSRTASLAILVPIRSPFIEISISQKSGHVFVCADCRDLTSLCLRLCIGVKLRAASGP